MDFASFARKIHILSIFHHLWGWEQESGASECQLYENRMLYIGG